MSTIPAVLAALKALAESVLDTGAWDVLPGGDPTSKAKDRWLSIGDEDIVGVDPETPSQPGEDYLVPLSAYASLPTTDQALADAVVIAAYKDIRDAVPTYAGGKLGLTAQGVLMAFPADEFRLERRGDDNGRHARMRFNIRIRTQNV